MPLGFISPLHRITFGFTLHQILTLYAQLRALLFFPSLMTSSHLLILPFSSTLHLCLFAWNMGVLIYSCEEYTIRYQYPRSPQKLNMLLSITRYIIPLRYMLKLILKRHMCGLLGASFYMRRLMRIFSLEFLNLIPRELKNPSIIEQSSFTDT
jgi:hypothetical protein